MANDLDVQAEIETPTGWLALEDMGNGYELHAESFAAKAVPVPQGRGRGRLGRGQLHGARGGAATSPRTCRVWVKGDDPYQLAVRIQALTDGLHQLQYRLRLTIGNMREDWVCQYSDYTIESDQTCASPPWRWSRRRSRTCPR